MGTSVKGWGQFRPSTPRQVARGASSGRHNGAKPSCHNHRIDDPKLPPGQYYLEMFNNNYWHVGSRTDIDWKSAGPSSASRSSIDGTSQALRYLVDEKAGTFRQDFGRDVPYSSVVSNVWRLGERTVEDQMVVNSGKSNEYSQRSADGTVLASYRYDSTGLGYRVFKESFQGYWYGA